MRNRAAVLHGVHDLRIDEVPVPEPGPGQVLVEVRGVGVCGSDAHYYEHGRMGAHVVREPLILEDVPLLRGLHAIVGQERPLEIPWSAFLGGEIGAVATARGLPG